MHLYPLVSYLIFVKQKMALLLCERNLYGCHSLWVVEETGPDALRAVGARPHDRYRLPHDSEVSPAKNVAAVFKDAFKGDHEILSAAPKVAGRLEGRKLTFSPLLVRAAQRKGVNVTINVPIDVAGL